MRGEIPRSELEQLPVRSHQLAHRATEEGRFEREIVPIAINGDTYVTDQGIRPETTLERLAELKPAFKPDGKITAATSSQISDGAAAVLLMARERAERLGLRPRARVVAATSWGRRPVIVAVERSALAFCARPRCGQRRHRDVAARPGGTGARALGGTLGRVAGPYRRRVQSPSTRRLSSPGRPLTRIARVAASTGPRRTSPSIRPGSASSL
jgi:hypothetical protein